MTSQSLAKLRSPAVLIAQNGNSLALPNYMADEVEESRANIVAALCSASSLAGPSRTHSHTNSVAQPWDSNISRAGSAMTGAAGTTDKSDDDVEDHASSPVQPVPLRSRRVLITSSSQQHYSPQPAGISSPGELSSLRLTSAMPQSPRIHTPLVSFSVSSPRRQVTPTSDSSVFRRGSAGGGGTAIASSATAVGSHTRRPLSASASTQAQTPTGPAAAAAQQDLVAAVTGRMIQNYDYDDDSLDEEELAWDLAAAQDTLARALEMARSGVATTVTTADGSPVMPRYSSVAAPVANGRIAAANGAATLGPYDDDQNEAGTCQQGMDGDINPAPIGEPGIVSNGGGPAAASVFSVAQRGRIDNLGTASEGILDRFGRTCQLEAISALGPSVTGCTSPKGGSGSSPGSPQPAAPSCPSLRSSLKVHSTASGSKASNVLGATVPRSKLATAAHGQTPYSSGPPAGAGFGLPLRRALHIGGADTDKWGDVEAGEGSVGSSDRCGKDGQSSDATSPTSAGRGIGRFSIKDVVRRAPAAASVPAATVTQRGTSRSDESSSQGGVHGLKGLFRLAKKAFRRSTVAPPSLPPSSPLPISNPVDCISTSPVSAPRTPPANPGASPGLNSTGHSTHGAVAIDSNGLTAPTAGKGSAASKLSGVSTGRQLPSSPVQVVAAVSQVNGATSYARSSTSGTEESTLTTRLSPSPAPLPLPLPSSLQGSLGRPSNGSADQVRSWFERGGSSSSSGSSSGGSPDSSMMHAIVPLPASTPGSYANSGMNGCAAVTPRRRSGAASAGGGHVAVSELQVTAHVQSFMHYRQQQLQQQQQQQQQLQQLQQQPLQQQDSVQGWRSGSLSAADTARSRFSCVRWSEPHELSSPAAATAAAADAMSSSLSGGAHSASCSASGEVERAQVSLFQESLNQRSPTWGSASTDVAGPAPKPPYLHAGSGGSGSGGSPAPLPPLPPPSIKTLPNPSTAVPSAGVGGSVGNPRWSPRSPASPSWHIGSPLGPYHQQPLQQRRSYSLSSQPTSPRTSLHDSSMGPPSPYYGEPSVAPPPAAAAVGTGAAAPPRPPYNSSNASSHLSHFSQEPVPVRTSRTSPTAPGVGPLQLNGSSLPSAAESVFDGDGSAGTLQ
ncbi:hypothetical protein VaNZ11_006015 [Volvox africanus]|uniref:Uncharacterized protein n=1 Tax=Volvox africanus TaxID=51714 RepID=A0ABQ5S027_9CHLO|nr:hypothetical protein VaNZ11_006015 [Volvox africanus]